MNNKFITLVIFLSISSLTPTIVEVYGHGLGAETFPPVDLNGKLITLEVSSSTNNPEETDDQQISISLIDFNSKITLRDVTFLIKSERGTQFLFEREFQADNGFIVFNFISEDTDSIEIVEEEGGDIFGSLLGLDSRKINIIGPKLSEGGLYKFDISVLTADGYSKKLDEPLVFNSGISIAQTKTHQINDPNFGTQEIQSITFYDEISDFQYNPDKREISFYMPFDWNVDNINQTSVVHEELIISKTFGDLLVSGFSMYINDVKLSDNIITIDDFFSDGRIVHFIVNQKELWNIYNQTENQDGMKFLVTPNSDETQLSSVTENGQFRILVSSEPENLKSNSNGKINFNIMDVFLKNRPIAVTYDFSMTQNGKTIHQQSGTSTDSKEEFDIAEFTIPNDITGIVYLNFENLNGNDLAGTSIPIVIDRIGDQNNEISIPEWIRNNAAWWAEGQIDDGTFIQGIEYLIKNDIILIPKTTQESSDFQEIPSWIKNNAAWWAEGQIDDETFVQGLQYLIQNGILRI
ncbi:MAG: peptidase [Nitrosopumilus sp.]|nr:peptidase [Nitrosopumilus sp.]